MKVVFADTGYWLAMLNPNDALHQRAIDVTLALQSFQIVTSEMVFVEVLNALSRQRITIRRTSVEFIRQSSQNPQIEVVPQTSEHFQVALAFYEQRLDKSWSHTDCTSFLIMTQRNISEALSHDRHFEQAGYVALLRTL